MCADCWGVKDAARAKRWLRQRSRTEPLLGLHWDDPLDLLWVIGGVVLVALVVIYALTEWT